MPNELPRSLVDELGALAPDDRSAVLALLNPGEREIVEATLRQSQASLAFEQAVMSPWLRSILDGEDDGVTPAARAALAGAIPETGPASREAQLGRFGDLIGRVSHSGGRSA